MRIAIVTQHPFPDGPDHRGRIVARTLVRGGHEVMVFTPRPTAADLDGLGIEVKSPGGPAILRRAIPFNYHWRNFLVREGKQHDIDCFLTKELRLATPVWMAARRLGVKFVMDLAENYPAMVSVEREGQMLLPVFREMAAFLERFCARRADAVVVVTESNRSRLIRLGVPAERITVVSNTPELDRWQKQRSRHSGPLQLVFAGMISMVRGLDRLLFAISEMPDRDALHLHIIGCGPEQARLESICNQRNLHSCVTFHGWMNRSQIEDSLSRYDMGVIPHIINEHTNTTIPGKLFDYMAAGLPVLATAMTPCEEVIKSVKCGCVSGDTTDELRKALQAILATAPEVRRGMGERGRLAILNGYNWKVDGARLLQVIDALRSSAVESVAQPVH